MRSAALLAATITAAGALRNEPYRAKQRFAPPAARRAGPDASRDPSKSFQFAPPLTLSKYQTMQSKRVRLIVRYSAGDSDEAVDHTKAYQRAKRLIQDRFPDVVIEGAPDYAVDDAFQVVVDGRTLYDKPTERSGVYLSMRLLQREIVRARQERRPTTTVYGAPAGGLTNGRAPLDVPKYD
mmetsp:Transcript_8673/g.26100  ORF Transcript_8673/g.26100 Transcript_8673/m.26100 type:complete len:181 (+) Transcript_8673:186-728(+)|eukprot:CAMPEP_0119269144 /NCGR_PEP_ID=MMETSP1329-20130426/6663_1 /TAXON_ID=114041 /ORGANISM="Genus nov. species nov., Strain RCC1024" /LENGTH=180 /DNA_ID=CAMNT_0007269137 /DNA_START=154 /DNA_END=696 /DNA_ORIENTATION=-